MDNTDFKEPGKVGFIGLGLIGGSLARTIRRHFPGCAITAYDKDEATLRQALSEQTIDCASPAIDASFSGCDYIFLCAPVSRNDDNLRSVLPYLGEHTILTDVGSVKAPIHRAVREAGCEPFFIGAHPMAGSEQSGYAHANDHLLENAYFILTPNEQTPAENLRRYEAFAAALGTLPLVLTAEEHDYITASVSHLPHVVAAALVNLVEAHDGAQGYMRLIAAGGFKDITRIASSSPAMWQQICLTNRENITVLLDDYIAQLTDIRRLLAKKDAAALLSMFADARDYRDSFQDAARGPIKKSYVLYCDIIDEAGAIATIATILATNRISMKNIGILHNREFEEGVLRIEFYDEDSRRQAFALLQKHRYQVIERQ